MSFYFIFLLLFKVFISYKLIRGNSFYFIFWRSSIIFYSSLFIGALLLNILFSIHSFNYNISNFLIPLLDLFYFLVFLIFFLLLLGKNISLVSEKYFYSTVNILLFFSLFYSFLNLYFVITNQDKNVLELLFPFGNLIKYAWVIGPLFGAFYWSKLSNNYKIILIFSFLTLILLTILNGRRSLILFILFFVVFYCLRTNILKKFLFILTLFSLYYSVADIHAGFKFSTRDQSLDERVDAINKNNSHGSIDSIVIRILHRYILIEPVHIELERIESVGLRPFKTAMYAPIPSNFLDSKPYPGSLNGDERSSFQYIVNDIAFNQPWNMSEYPIPLEFIWHGSYLQAFFSIILSILIMVAFYRVSIFFGDRLAILPLLAVYPGDYNYFEPGLIQVIEIFSYNYLPGFIILFFLIFIKSLLKSNYNKNLNPPKIDC
jgi:hypothetical protein